MIDYGKRLSANAFVSLFQSYYCREDKTLKACVIYIVSVYLPSFLMTHLTPPACEGPFVRLFQRDLLLAFEAVDSDVSKVVNRYFLQHANSWLSPHKLL